MSSERKTASTGGLANLMNRNRSDGGEASEKDQPVAEPVENNPEPAQAAPTTSPPATPEAPPASPPAPAGTPRRAGRSKPHLIGVRLSEEQRTNFDNVLLACRVQMNDNDVSRSELVLTLINRYVTSDDVDELCQMIRGDRASGL